MLTYQLQSRTYRIEDSDRLPFPNDVVVEMDLEPPTLFGSPGDPTRTGVKSQSARVIWDGNSGRGFIQSNFSLKPLEVFLEYPNLRLELLGNKLTLKTSCEEMDDFNELITSVYYTFPLLLNLEIVDPPRISRVYGKVGETSFRWELKDFRFGFDITTQEQQEKRILSSLERLTKLKGIDNRRLIAALHYFHIACRLNMAGSSPWEFMAEIILNLAKVLQVLFGEYRDDVRHGLRQLQYSDEEIERYFIPIMILRNEFDVGHATISILTREELDCLYKYLIDIELTFRNFLSRLVQQVESGIYTLTQEVDLSLDTDKRKVIQVLIQTIQKEQS